jgi:hypothetical protein
MGWKLSAVFLVACGAAFAQSSLNAVLLLSECSDSAQVRRVVQSSDMVAVRHSLAGGEQTCYAVSITAADGNLVEGFLLGARHPALIAFERNEQTYISQALPQPSSVSQPQAKVPARPKHYGRKLWNPFGSRAAGTK